MFVTNWISTTKIQKISEITNFFRHYFLSRTEVLLFRICKFMEKLSNNKILVRDNIHQESTITFLFHHNSLLS